MTVIISFSILIWLLLLIIFFCFYAAEKTEGEDHMISQMLKFAGYFFSILLVVVLLPMFVGWFIY